MDQVLEDINQIIAYIKGDRILTFELVKLKAVNVHNFYSKRLTALNAELSIDVFMRKENGGIYIIMENLRNGDDIKMEKITQYFINALEKIVNNHPFTLKKYNAAILGVSISCLKSGSNRVKCTSVRVLIKLLGSGKCSEGDSIIIQIISVVFQQLPKHTTVIGSLYYHLLGTLCEFFPKLMSIHSALIIDRLLNHLEIQVKGTNQTLMFIEGYLNGLNGILVNFSHLCSQSNNYTNKIIVFLKGLLNNVPGKRDVSTSAFSLLERHLQVFEYGVLNDYEQWHDALMKNLITKSPTTINGDLRIRTLTKFYQLIVNHLSSTKTENTDSMFQFFMKYFNEVIYKADPLPHDIVGFAYFFPALKMNLTHKKYTSVFLRILHSCIKFSEQNNIAKYLMSIAVMMSQDRGLVVNALSLVEKLITSALYFYPKSSMPDDLAGAIVKLLIVVSTFNPKSLDLIAYSAVVYQCSCRTLIDVVRLNDIGYDNLLTYKSFVPLWKNLFYWKDYSNIEEFNSSSRIRFTTGLCDSFMKAVLKIIGKLDYSLKTRSALNDDKYVYYGPEGIMEAINPGDISVFVNLVSLFEETLIQSDTDWFNKWKTIFIFTIVRFSIANPLISGFYKLVSVAFMLSPEDECHKGQFENVQLNNWLSLYVRNTLLGVRYFKDDLQISCLRLLATAPVEIIRPHLDLLGPTLKVIFNSGTPNFETARYGVMALEKWLKAFDSHEIFPVIKCVLHFFRTYLINNGAISDKQNSGFRIQNENTMQDFEFSVIPDEEILEVQQKILLLLARVDSKTIEGFLLQCPKMIYGIKKSLGIKLLFNGIGPTIYLDLFLPRILELAMNSIDHQARISSCEFLHLIVVYIFGASLQLRVNTYDELIKIISPVVLRLAADPDEVVCAIFRPLTEQMSHIFASKLYYKTKMCAAFVEAVMLEVTENTDIGVRYISAFCLKEFISWSLKCLDNNEIMENPVNIIAVVNMINRNLIHPNINARVGAAIVFNNIYSFLKSDTLLLDKYSFVILYNMVCSLTFFEDDNGPLFVGLDLIVDLIIMHKDLFNQKNGLRIKPDDFHGCLLCNAVEWLFTKCCSSPQKCQIKCMSLASTLARCLQVDCGLSSLIQKRFTRHDLVKLDKNDISIQTLQNMANKSEDILKWMSGFLSSLSYFKWLIKDLTMPVNILDEDDCCLIDGLNAFLTILSYRDLQSVLEYLNLKCKPEGYNGHIYNELKISAVLDIFDMFMFITQHNIFSRLQEGAFEELLFYCLFEPSKLGFVYKNSKCYDELSKKIIEYLPVFKSYCMETDWINLTKNIGSTGIKKVSLLFSKIEVITEGSECVTFLYEEIVSGISIIVRTGMFTEFFPAWPWTTREVLCTLEQSLLAREMPAVVYSTNTFEFTKLVLQLTLLINVHDVSSVLEMICNPEKIKLTGNQCAPLGNYILSLFEDVIINFLSLSAQSVMEFLFEEFTVHKIDAIIMLLKCCHFTNESFSRFGVCIVNSVISKWKKLILWGSKDIEFNEKLIRIINHCIETMQPDTAAECFSNTDISEWILNCIELETDLDVCLPYLKLLPYISEKSIWSIIEIIQCRYLKMNWRNEYIGTDFFVDLYELWITLLTTLKFTGNFSVASVLIKYSCNENNMESISEAVKTYASRFLLDRALKLDEAYNFIMVGSDVDKFRLDVLKYYFIPLLKTSKNMCILVDFICMKLPDMQNILEEELCDNKDKALDQLIKKIAVCKVVDVSFAMINYGHLTDKIRKEKLKSLLSQLYKVRSLRCLHSASDYPEIWHLFQSCAYNCLISLLSNIHDNLNLYSRLIFKEDISKGSVIWENIIDNTKEFILSGKRPMPKLISSSVKEEKEEIDNGNTHLELIKSLTVSQSSLFLDCNKYDFLKIVEFQPLPDSATNAMAGIEIELEMDTINKHECMPAICAVIRHMCSKNNLADSQVANMPQWMIYLYGSLTTSNRPQYVYIFLLRIIFNCRIFFRPFAKTWLLPILQCLINKTCGDEMNYFLSDIVGMIISWHDNAVPSECGEKIAASSLVKYLLLLNNSNKSKTIHVIGLIKDIINVWKDSVSIPYMTLETLLEGNSVKKLGLCATELFITSDNHSFEIESAIRFFHILSSDVTNYERDTNKTGMVLGSLLNTISKGGTKDIDDCISKISDHLHSLLRSNKSIFLNTLIGIVKNFPSMGDRFFASVKDILLDKKSSFLHNSCLVVMLGVIRHPIHEEFGEQMIEVGLLDLMDNSNEKIRYSALQIVHKLFELTTIQDKIVLRLLKLVKSLNSDEARKIVFKSLMLYYLKERKSQRMIDLLAEVKAELIKGMFDSNHTISSEMFKFWSNIEDLPEKTTESLMFLMTEMYTPSTERYFFGGLLNLLLRTITINEKIFPEPLSACDFKEQIMGSVPYVSLAPMFVESYTSETLRNISGNQNQKSTFKNSMTHTTVISERTSAQKRFYSGRFSQESKQNVKSNISFNYTEKLCRRVQLLRTYRTGDIPDIEVPYLDLINLLRELSKDPLIAQVHFTSLVSGICSELQKINEDSVVGFKNDLSSLVAKISESTELFDIAFFLTLFQAVYENDLMVPSSLIEVCKRSGLEQVGVILFENQLANDDLLQEPPKKIKKVKIISNDNIDLLQLYVRLNEEDVVRGIFHSISGDNKVIQAALSAELNENWFEAQNVYCELIKDSSAELGTLFYTAIFKCMAQIGDWDRLNEELKSQVENKLDDFWSISWNRENLLPWYFMSGINLLLSGTDSSFLDQILMWMGQYSSRIKNFFGEELCMLYLCKGELLTCKYLSEELVKKHISLMHHLRILPHLSSKQLLMKFKMLLEIHSFCMMNNKAQSAAKLINLWSHDMPQANDSLLHWNVRSTYRNYFINLLEKKCIETDSNETGAIASLKKFKLEVHFHLFDCAYIKNNYFVAQKCLTEAQKLAEFCEDNLLLQLKLSQAKILLARLKSTWKEKINTLLEAQEIVSVLMSEQKAHPLLYQHAASVLSEVRQLLKCHSDEIAFDNTIVEKLLKIVGVKIFSSMSELLHSVNDVILMLLHRSVDLEHEGIGETYLTIAKYYILLRKKENYGPGVNCHIITCLLRSMSYNNLEASQLFPELLQLDTLHDKDLNIFLYEYSKVPEWMFLPWLPQILSGLDNVQVSGMGPLAVKLSCKYPQILRIPFYLSKENFTYKTSNTKHFVERLSSILQIDQTHSQFIDASQSLCYPSVMLYNCIYKIMDLIHSENKNIDSLIDETMHKCFRRSSTDKLRGKLFEINEPYRHRFKCASDSSKVDTTIGLKELKLLNEELKSKISDINCGIFKINDFCPWLAGYNYERGDIEIPFQYTVHNAFLATRPIKLVSFKSTVKVINSLRHPILFTMTGSDGNQYPWLIKFGEDLRQDQRIQQLFQIMDHSLKIKNKTGTLHLNTYSVVPLTLNHGFIQWVKETKTLKEFIADSLTNDELNLKSNLVEKHYKWIAACSKHLKVHHLAIIHTNAVLRYSKPEVESEFRKLSMVLPQNMLRRAFYNLCNSPELYYEFRTEFLRSYAILCSCHWLLGIGDRHLGNTLICIESGLPVGIDFGCAFGTATRCLPIPELVPFRLTPQILNLYYPLRQKGLIRETMVKCLSSLNKDVVLAAMQVFIKEPTLDWTSTPRRVAKNMGQDLTSDWSPNFGYEIAEKKLNAGNPVELMFAELKSREIEKPILDKYLSIIKGEFNKRSTFGNELTYEEQVECLIEQACDEYILGLSRSQFEPWI